ncbi:glucose-1-phosphate adenylyltransferase subunit GlgD [Propionispira raffinosivorans]|uniref:glucose-1-phosphate adenylyltransferase subunit GlgD n=1 Tax=Propionispira raffinosivorans TaxID=86959 RepID=UPI000375BB82|nr:glucose-1-phosphate adenylyltransferase subunit GlgD [Propionispira raffinosivorans]
MKTVMGIIDLQENDKLIKEMTAKRPLAAVPFAGRYRLIDFSLSSMVNSGMDTVGILLPNKSRSILDHLRSGKDWDLARKHDGLFYLPPAEAENGLRNGNIQSFYRHLDFIANSSQKYVLISGSRIVYNMNFDNVLRFHQNTGADITMVYNMESTENTAGGTVIKTAENGLVQDIAVQAVTYEDAKVAMGIYLMDKNIFTNIVESCFSHGGTNFLIDGLMHVDDSYSIYGFKHDGYVARINSTASYYKASMEILNPEIWQEIFMNVDRVYTKVKDEAPAQYKKNAKATNSLIANGCVVEGTVENSILFRGVKVGKGVHVKNSIVMQKCDLQEDALIENVICDKNVVITHGKWLKGASNYPLIVEKGVVI